MSMRWLRAHIVSLPQIQAEVESLQMNASAFPHMDKGGRTRHLNGLRARMQGAWTYTVRGHAYDVNGNLMLTSGQDVRRWFRSIGL